METMYGWSHILRHSSSREACNCHRREREASTCDNKKKMAKSVNIFRSLGLARSQHPQNINKKQQFIGTYISSSREACNCHRRERKASTCENSVYTYYDLSFERKASTCEGKIKINITITIYMYIHFNLARSV